ncbi:trichohyalin-like isoform X1 [Ambystoma mexicanum]|uniref:trichohyalin-like isoform X1 n=1 Tax=Ambystoma mexicanum TaxID=8296 RepID=UPI0037E7E4C9
MEGGGLPNTDLIAQGIPLYPPMGEPPQPRRESGASSGEARDLTPDALLTMKNPGQIYSNSSQRAWTPRTTARRRRVRTQTSLETANGSGVRARTSQESANGSGAARKRPVYQEREREEKPERGKTENELPKTKITGEQENQKEDSQMKSPETKESMETHKREAKKEKEIQGYERGESTAKQTSNETIAGKEKEDKVYRIALQTTVRPFEKQRRAQELHRKKIEELEREQTQEKLEMQKKEENLQRKIQEELEHQRSEVALKEEKVKEDLKRQEMDRQKIENAKLDIHGVQLELQRDRRKEEHYEQEREEEMHMKRIEEELERQKREEALEEQKHQKELEKTEKEMEHMEEELARKTTEWQRQREIQDQRLAMQKRQLKLARQEREEKQKREEEYRRQKLEEEAQRKKEEELHRQQIKEREEVERKELEKQTIERQIQRQKLQQQLEDQKREHEKQRQKREQERELQRRKRDMERQKREKELMMQRKEKEIGANFEKVIQDFMQFEGNVPVKSMSLRDHVKSLKEVADAVDQDNRVANYAGVTGATLSVAGGIITLSGAALAPFTGGASLVASVGVGGAFAGGLTRVLGSVKEKLDQKKNEKRVDEILNSCLQTLEGMESDYIEVWTKMEELEKKMQELEMEMEQLNLKYREFIQELKRRLSMFEPALKAEMFKVVLRSITHLTARILSRVMVEKVSQEVSHVAATEIAKQVAEEMSKRSTSYWSYEAIKEFLTFSSREVSKKWYVDVARTSAVASGVAAAVFLPFDVKDLRQEATNLTKGAKSEMAEEIRNVAHLLLKLTCTFEELV